jgi:hypothetical protein
MTLNASGQISLAGTTAGQSIELELGGTGTTTISLNDTNVRTLSGTAAGTQVSFSTFYGKSNFTPYNQYVSTVGSTTTVTAPTGSKNVTIYMWGAGGGGGQNPTGTGGGGGGGGAYLIYSMAVTGGTTAFSCFVGRGGKGGIGQPSFGGSGSATSVSNTALSLSLSAGGGGGGSQTSGGAAGTQTGGQTGSVSGSAGGSIGSGSGGNAGGTGVSITATSPTPTTTFQGGLGDTDGAGGKVYGGGGAGPVILGFPSASGGANGAIVFAWT